MAIIEIQSPTKSHQSTILAGETSDIIVGYHDGLLLPGTTVAIDPASGGTALVQYTLSPIADVIAGASSVIWRNWGEGSVTESTVYVFTGRVTALRATATDENAVWEVA